MQTTYEALCLPNDLCCFENSINIYTSIGSLHSRRSIYLCFYLYRFGSSFYQLLLNCLLL